MLCIDKTAYARSLRAISEPKNAEHSPHRHCRVEVEITRHVLRRNDACIRHPRREKSQDVDRNARPDSATRTHRALPDHVARRRAQGSEGAANAAGGEPRAHDVRCRVRVYKIELEGKKPRTQRDYKRILDKYFLPPFEKKDLASLTYEGIVKITNPLPKSEKAHALAVMRTFLRWCVRPPRRYIKHSPLEGVEITLAKSRKRVLTDSEIPIVWRAGRRSRWRARATGIRSRNRALSGRRSWGFSCRPACRQRYLIRPAHNFEASR